MHQDWWHHPKQVIDNREWRSELMAQQAFVQPQRQVQGSTPMENSVLQRKCSKCSKKKKKPTLQLSKVSPAPEMMPTVPEEQRPSAAVDAATYAFMMNAPGDVYEQEADRVADQVMATPREAVRSAPPQIQRLAESSSGQMEAPTSVGLSLAGPGRPLEAVLRHDMEQSFGYDFSSVRVHTGAAAGQSARDVNAHAYTLGHDIVFGADRYTPGTHQGRRLIAHELAHVVQQSQTDLLPLVQRQSFTGGPGKTAKDKDRPLTAFQGPMLPTTSPGGTVVPGTASTAQNCAGDSCNINKYINWPFLGLEAPGFTLPANVQGDWSQANNFVPTGCTRVNCSGVDVHSTRCKSSELELIAFLYRWPVQLNVNGNAVAGTQSDFHMIGRDATGLPSGWHSKMDRREKVVDIRDPWQSLHDSYPHTTKKDRTKVQLCFCCNQSAIKTT
jgi:hypothetical protein